uniref:NADH dehydrogenase subunit 6 n=1 Tax=Aegilips sp. ZJUH 20220002 TaxID=2943451 RepID=A0A9E8G6N5_9HYME|nr:NADH dehydrogenase subunit 6 [Aegilips sp. ZJUH 20220002]
MYMMKIFLEMYYSYFFLLLIFLGLMMLVIPLDKDNLHPLILGLIMLIYSVLVMLMMMMFSSSSFYSFVMFMVIVGGFLILFLYFNSFAINNKIMLKYISLKYIMYKFILIMMIYLMINNQFNDLLSINDSLIEMNFLLNFFYMFDFNLNNDILYIYNKFYFLSLFGIIYLFYSMIIVIKVIYLSNLKTLRQLII